MRNIKLTIEYDGRDFHGWQKQPGKLNIQGEIEKAISTITGEETELNASRKNRCRSSCTSGKLRVSRLIVICL